MDLNVGVQDGNHISGGSLPAWDSGLGQAFLLWMGHHLHQAWVLLIDGADINIQLCLQLFYGIHTSRMTSSVCFTICIWDYRIWWGFERKKPFVLWSSTSMISLSRWAGVLLMMLQMALWMTQVGTSFSVCIRGHCDEWCSLCESPALLWHAILPASISINPGCWSSNLNKCSCFSPRGVRCTPVCSIIWLGMMRF